MREEDEREIVVKKNVIYNYIVKIIIALYPWYQPSVRNKE